MQVIQTKSMMEIIYSTYSQFAKKGVFFSLLRKETNTPNELILVSSCAGCALPGDFAVVAAASLPTRSTGRMGREDGKLSASWESLGKHSPLPFSTHRASCQAGKGYGALMLQVKTAESRSPSK